ncbi:zinc metallopeptidase [Niameybacter massiliensis]|uniref:Zinc metallopeptidase n=1 Tax=Holtiella tumoricola TaxID=3018743 RepID=A0AA42DQ02_9FIRM|nr:MULTISPECIES: zinc metallopeptidase [Lachnospirales]MDA3733105.1 zinc metallopeptidase [Holtiella tumoricola]
MHGTSNSLYWILFLGISIVPLWASMKLQSTFSKYSRVRCLSGYTGEEAARRILMIHHLGNIGIRPIRGSMTDHYNPMKKEIGLSETTYSLNSIAAVSVAAHEVGHVLQESEQYGFLNLRHKLIPVTNFANSLSLPMVFLGAITSLNGLLWIGIILFSFTTLFSFVTLPVEFNASKRALVALSNSGILSDEELDGAKEVLQAAALTYVAGAATSLMMLLRLLLIYGGNDRD